MDKEYLSQEVSKSQVDKLEAPFVGVTPKITNGLWKAYEKSWALENNVEVKFIKETSSDSNYDCDDTGKVTKLELVNESIIGYSIELNQKIANIALRLYTILIYDGTDRLSKRAVYSSLNFVGDSQDEMKLLERQTIDSDVRSKLYIPDLDTIEDVISFISLCNNSEPIENK